MSSLVALSSNSYAMPVTKMLFKMLSKFSPLTASKISSLASVKSSLTKSFLN